MVGALKNHLRPFDGRLHVWMHLLFIFSMQICSFIFAHPLPPAMHAVMSLAHHTLNVEGHFL